MRLYSRRNPLFFKLNKKHQTGFFRKRKGFRIMVITERELSADFVVVGGGMAGVCAAAAAARNGVRTLVVQDRPMFGGNASSEIRMWICGAHGENRKETGLLEELQLENYYYNPLLKYTVWDDVIYSFLRREKNLTMLLNTSVESVETDNGRILSVTGWNLIEYCRYRIRGKLFADCSGDGILRLSGAKYMQGREARSEFDESHAPETADRKTMGNTILIQLRRTKTHRPFRAPEWAYHYTEADLPNRYLHPEGNNFWWMEFGGVRDTISDAEEIRDELYKIAYGVWELIKNHPDGRGHEWELDWIGSLPGKRESVRFVGDHVLCQKEVEAGGRFPDVVCYGGWTMDDHHPEAIRHPGPPTIYHPAPSPFGIPYRSLYSANVDNLFFAGRQASTTHMALSATRVMATAAMMGQAVGTAAALALRYGTTPRGVYEHHIDELQQTLLDQDQFLPDVARRLPELTLRATASHEVLRDGWDRNWDDGCHEAEFSAGESAYYRFSSPEIVRGCRLVFDSDLADKKQQRNVEEEEPHDMPPILPRAFRVEGVRPDGTVALLREEKENIHRLVRAEWQPEAFTEIRLTGLVPWGGEKARVFSFDVF